MAHHQHSVDRFRHGYLEFLYWLCALLMDIRNRKIIEENINKNYLSGVRCV